ncbi:MAG: hypothetical protein ACTIJA_05840 [Bavariicoccus seileri]|uniref:Uncharacterized protein n=1 Tax=Bavariicoccus seileri TaxID=549685 RepID=A0A3D4S7C2_9ENTE|nr:hypothetical protein [Bavariicoccus seileri]HCS93851.1 hypothetical protein [Bavariicoccus seileri]
MNSKMTNDKRKKDLLCHMRKTETNDIANLTSNVDNNNTVSSQKNVTPVTIEYLIKESMTQYHELLDKMSDR